MKKREIIGDRSNHRLNCVIEKYIDTWVGTIIGLQVKNMYENGTDYESICEVIGEDYADYEE